LIWQIGMEQKEGRRRAEGRSWTRCGSAKKVHRKDHPQSIRKGFCGESNCEEGILVSERGPQKVQRRGGQEKIRGKRVDCIQTIGIKGKREGRDIPYRTGLPIKSEWVSLMEWGAPES